jgi:hypothetical protein
MSGVRVPTGCDRPESRQIVGDRHAGDDCREASAVRDGDKRTINPQWHAYAIERAVAADPEKNKEYRRCREESGRHRS